MPVYGHAATRCTMCHGGSRRAEWITNCQAFEGEDYTMVSALDDLMMNEQVERLAKSVGKAKTAIADTLNDSKRAAARMIKRGQYAVEGAVQDKVHRIRRKPIASVALAFTAGIAVGCLA